MEQSYVFQNEVLGDIPEYMSLSLNQSTDVTSSNEDSCTQFETDYSTRGGTSTIFLSTKTVAEKLEEWKHSITDENQFPIGHKLEYIWTLLDHEEMNPQKAVEVKNYIQGKWETQYDEIDLEEDQFEPAKDHREKKLGIDDTITIKQPEEEKGFYGSRSITKPACHFVEGHPTHTDQGKWNLDNLYCEDGKLCLKWGIGCYAGRIDLPEGIEVLTYRDFNFNTKKTEFHGPTNDQNYWDFWDRTCGFKFSLKDGYTCDSKPECTLD